MYPFYRGGDRFRGLLTHSRSLPLALVVLRLERRQPHSRVQLLDPSRLGSAEKKNADLLKPIPLPPPVEPIQFLSSVWHQSLGGEGLATHSGKQERPEPEIISDII